MLGDEVFHYDPGHYLVFTVDLPLTFQVEQATEEEPYFGMRLNLRSDVVASVMSEAEIKFRKGDARLQKTIRGPAATRHQPAACSAIAMRSSSIPT